MKRKITILLAVILILNMLSVNITILPMTKGIAASVETFLIPLEDFNSSTDINSVIEAGWSMSGTCSLVTDAQDGQNFKVVAGNAYKTFTPVPIKSGTAYTNPGKNARIVLEFDAYSYGGTSVSSYYRLDQSTTTQAFSIGKRGSRTKYEWTNSLDSSLSKALVSDNITKFMKFKAEIKITDANGNYLSNGPSVSVWCNNNLYLAGIPVVSSGCTFVDRFYFTCGSGVTNELDNVSVKLITDETTPTQYTVSTTVDSGGSGTGTIAIPSGTSSLVNSGDGKSVYITPASGNYIEYLKVNNVNVDISTLPYNNYGGYYIYTIPNITTNVSVNVRFSVPVDLSALSEKLTEGYNVYTTANANIGTLEGQYTLEKVSALSAAIASAQAVYDSTSVTQAQVNQAVIDLQAAIGVCTTNTPTPVPVVTTLITDNFNSYVDITAVQNAGWTTGTAAIATNTAVPENSQFLKMTGSTAYKTFSPVPIKSGTAYTNPGKNAKIVMEFDAYTTGGSAANAYYRLDQGTTTQAFSIGKRSSRTKYEWTNSIDSSLSKALISNSITRFMKFKAEIKLTDSNGNYLSNGPSVSVWCNDQLYLAGIPAVSSSCTYVDRFYFSCGSSVTSELDNVSVKLITDETTPTQYTVSTTVDLGGTGTGTIAIPSGTSSLVNSGDGKSVYITPASGKYIEYLKVNNVNVDISTLSYNNYGGYYIYTIPNITTNVSVNVRFTNTAP